MLDQVTSRRTGHRQPAAAGFTLIEAIVTVAILGVIMTLVAPSAVDWIVMQRVKSSASELVTDIRFARGESIKRGQPVVLSFKTVAGTQTCYTVHTRAEGETRACNCAKGASKACDVSPIPGFPMLANTLVELKLVAVPASSKVELKPNRAEERFQSLNGMPDPGMAGSFDVDIDGKSSRLLRVVTNVAGRPVICAPSGSRIVGYPACT